MSGRADDEPMETILIVDDNDGFRVQARALLDR